MQWNKSSRNKSIWIWWPNNWEDTFHSMKKPIQQIILAKLGIFPLKNENRFISLIFHKYQPKINQNLTLNHKLLKLFEENTLIFKLKFFSSRLQQHRE